MSDDKKKVGEPDRSKINTSERYEMDYWKDKSNVSSQQLTGAVGSNAKDVKRYLKDKK